MSPSVDEGMGEDVGLLAHARSRIGMVLREKYTIDRLIGVGGMASVYAATHRNGRHVALKLLHPDLSTRADLRKRFLREAQAANAVKHPGVVAVIDDDVAEGGSAFLVMELLDGQSVEDLWEAQGQKLSIRTVLTLARDLCDVLIVAHAAGVIHRDLKPANLFVTHEGVLKVLDFGIASVRDEAGPRATQTGSVLGTPAFMAPEQAGGLIKEVGPLTDVWAVGATMFTLLTGQPVHEGQSAQHIVVLSATTPARSLASAMTEAPNDVVAVVDRALAFDKGERWPSIAAMREALVEAIHSLAAHAAPIGFDLDETLLAVAGVRRIPERAGTLRSPGNGGAPILGATTGQPVSSEPITAVDHGPAARCVPAWKRMLRAFGDWRAQFARADAPEKAVSSDAPTVRRFPVRWRLATAVAVTAFVTGATATVLTRGHVDSPPTPVDDANRVASQAAPPAATSIEQSGIRDEVAPPIVPPAALPDAPSRPSPPIGGRGARSTPRSRASAPSSAPSTRINCTPPFTIQDGIQVHKTGCP